MDDNYESDNKGGGERSYHKTTTNTANTTTTISTRMTLLQNLELAYNVGDGDNEEVGGGLRKL